MPTPHKEILPYEVWAKGKGVFVFISDGIFRVACRYVFLKVFTHSRSLR